jgi:transposase
LSPSKSEVPRPPVPEGTRTVAWAASRARIRKDGSWNATRASPSFVGIDVSKDRLDVHVVPSGRTFAAHRDGKGLEQLVGDLRQFAPALVVLEATGGLEITVAAALASANLPVAVVNPRQIRDFARATGRLAKTDALDAEAIARFAERIRPEPRPLADTESLSLGELVARRRQVVEMIGMETRAFSCVLES